MRKWTMLITGLCYLFTVNSSASTTALHQHIVKLMQQYHIPGGSIAIMRHRKLIYARGLGWSDKENHIRAKATTLFRIASISKTITAIAILKLVEEKKIKT